MKNTLLSIIAALFIVMIGAHAADVDVLDSAIKFNTDDVGRLLLRNNLNTTVTVSLNNEITLAGTEDKFNISFSGNLNPLQVLNVTLAKTSISNLESGTYRGTVNIKAVNGTNTSQVLSVSPSSLAAEVVIGALKVKTIKVEPQSVKRGETIKVTVEYENTADKTDLEEVEVEVTVYEGDTVSSSKILKNLDDDELTESDDGKDVGNGDTASVSFEFVMPFEMDDGDEFLAEAKVTASSEETGEVFSASKTDDFKAKVNPNEVIMTSAQVVPTTLSCGVKTARFNIELQNIGEDSEDVQAFLRNPATGKEYTLNNGEDIELEDDFTDEEEFTEELSETIILDDLKDGTNTYNVVAYFDNGKKQVSKELLVTSQSCNPTANTPTTDNTVVVVPPTITDTNIPVINGIPNLPTAQSTPYVALKDVSGVSFNSDWMIPTIIGIGGLVIGLAVALLVVPRR